MSITWDSEAMGAETLAEFQMLFDRRELATLNCVNAIQFVLAVFEAQEFEESRRMLADALNQYRAADDAITAFHVRITKKENTNGNRSAA
jgi:hypothetical protein